MIPVNDSLASHPCLDFSGPTPPSFELGRCEDHLVIRIRLLEPIVLRYSYNCSALATGPEILENSSWVGKD